MVKNRSVAVAILLTIVTCGIYGLYWFVCLNDDLNELTDENGTSGGIALLLCLVTCGIYSLYWMYKAGEKVDRLKEERGLNQTYSGIVYLVLGMLGFGIVSYALIQDELNKNAQ